MLNPELLPDPERRLGPGRRLSGYICLRPHIPPHLTQLLPSSPTRQSASHSAAGSRTKQTATSGKRQHPGRVGSPAAGWAHLQPGEDTQQKLDQNLEEQFLYSDSSVNTNRRFLWGQSYSEMSRKMRLKKFECVQFSGPVMND